MTGPKVTAVTLPNVGDGIYDLLLFDAVSQHYVDSGKHPLADTRFQFDGDGVTRFEIKGIEISAALDPKNPLAFKTGLEFGGAGDASIKQIPLVTAVPLPGAVWLLSSALLVLV